MLAKPTGFRARLPFFPIVQNAVDGAGVHIAVLGFDIIGGAGLPPEHRLTDDDPDTGLLTRSALLVADGPFTPFPNALHWVMSRTCRGGKRGQLSWGKSGGYGRGVGLQFDLDMGSGGGRDSRSCSGRKGRGVGGSLGGSLGRTICGANAEVARLRIRELLVACTTVLGFLFNEARAVLLAGATSN